MNLRFHALLLICVTLLFPLAAGAQSNPLKTALEKATHDTTRCRILNQLIESENDETVWPKYNERLLQITEKHLDPSDPLKKEFLRYRAYGVNNLGYIANLTGENEKALKHYEEALAIQKEIGDKHGMAGVLYNLGDLRALQGDLHGALEDLHLSLKLHEEVKDERGAAYVLNDLGWHYHVQGDDENAFRYLEKALEIRKNLDDIRGLANTYNNLGLICLDKAQLEKGKQYFREARKLMNQANDARGEALALNNLGAIFHSQGNYAEALENFRRSAEIQAQTGDKSGWGTAMTNIADVMHDAAKGNRRQLQEALKIVQKSMAGAQQLGLPTDIRHAARTTYRIYRSLGDYKNAFEFYTLYVQMRDSITNQETKRAAVKRQLQYQYDRKAAADSVRNQEAQKVMDAQLQAQQAQLKQEKTQRYALYGGLLLIGVFLVFILNRFNVIRRQKAIIEEQKKQVDHAYESLHEKNKEVLDSIHYAKRIQKALITSEKYVQRQLERLRNRG